MSVRSRILQSAAWIGIAGALAAPQAFAQTAPADAAAQTAQEVVVTATRVGRQGFDAPTPTTVLSAVELDTRGLSQVGEFLLEAPSFRSTQTPQSNPQSARGAGQYFADLRGLGSIRTLVLVNGRRHVPSSPEGVVDLNLVPSIMVERIEVVTGGASAQWGSDAVAGVVNIMLDDDLEGGKADLSYGVTTHGDNEEFRLSLAYGLRYGGDRGRFVAGAEYVDSSGVLSHWDREFGREQHEQVSYVGARPANAPSRFFAAGVTPINMSRGGLIIGPNASAPGQPLYGITFGQGGQVLPFTYGNQIGTAAINFTGGDPQFSIRSGHTLILPVERQVAFAATHFDLSEQTTLFAELSYARAGSDFFTAYVRDNTPTGIVIQRDNPFIPAPVLAIMTQRNIASFALGREHRDFGRVPASNYNTTQRLVAGAEGRVGESWNWDVYYQYGRNEFDSTLQNLRVNANMRFAVDAIRDPATGQIVCRDAAARAAGCVPINLFGEGSPSREAVRYVTGTALYNIETTQHVFAANLRGEPFSTWAGAVSVAGGVERREEESISVVDAISQANGFAYGNPKNFAGSYTVDEAYLEIVAPLAADQPFARALDVNAAVRYADYSTSGGVWTWKAGVTWEVNDAVRVRATRSRDIRAPNNSELYAETTAQVTLRNPWSGASPQITTVSRSSPTLQPEEADTLTVGLVVSPPFLEGLRLSVDYFDIDIAGAISSYAPQNILDNCFTEANAGRPGFFCSFVTRTGTGAATVISRLETQLLNIAGFQNRGVDFEAAYRFDLWGGRADVRVFGTYTMDFISDDGLRVPRTFNAAGVIQNVGSRIDRAGQVGGFTSTSVTGATSAAEWIVNASLTYSRDRWRGYLQGRYVDGGLIDAALVGPGDADYNPASPISIANNRIKSRFYMNASLTYEFSDRLEIYGVVNNIADVQPPFPYTAAVGFYDRVGRTYKAGARFSF